MDFSCVVEEIWSNHGKVCSKVQMSITFKPKLQNEWFFLHFDPYNMYFPSIPLFDMNFICMAFGLFMKFLEENCIKPF
jgi:hypothetical protein